MRILGLRDSSGDRLDVQVDESGGLVVRILDKTGAVIRQVPPEEIVALARRLGEVIGLIFDRKA